MPLNQGRKILEETEGIINKQSLSFLKEDVDQNINDQNSEQPRQSVVEKRRQLLRIFKAQRTLIQRKLVRRRQLCQKGNKSCLK